MVMGTLKVLGFIIAVATAPLWTGLYLVAIFLVVFIFFSSSGPLWVVALAAGVGYLVRKMQHSWQERHRSRYPIDLDRRPIPKPDSDGLQTRSLARPRRSGRRRQVGSSRRRIPSRVSPPAASSPSDGSSFAWRSR